MHAVSEALVDLRYDDGFLSEAGFHELACIGELLGDGGNEGFVVEGGYALEEFGVGKAGFGQTGFGQTVFGIGGTSSRRWKWLSIRQ
jgi:hypothetical protein